METSSQKGGGAPSPIFGPFLLWPNGWMHQDATWYGGRPTSTPSTILIQPGDFVFDGDPAASPKRGRSPSPIFGPCLFGQTAAWINMPLGTEVGLGPDDIVLHGDPALPSPKGGIVPCPIFGPCLLWPNCWMDQGGTCHGGGHWSRPHCARWGHSSLPQKRDRAPPHFWPMSIVAKQLDGLRRHLVRK